MQGKLCTLNTWKQEYAEPIVVHGNNEKMGKYMLLFPFPYSKSDADMWIELNATAEMKGKNFAICIQENGKEVPVGGIGLKTNNFDVRKHCVEIGYWLGEQYWGRGIVADAVKLMVNYAFSEEFQQGTSFYIDTFHKYLVNGGHRVSRIEAVLFGGNTQSQRVLEKNGFTFEAKLSKYYYRNGQYLPLYRPLLTTLCILMVSCMYYFENKSAQIDTRSIELNHYSD